MHYGTTSYSYSKLAGIKVTEYDVLPDGMKVAIRDEQNNIIYGKRWCDIIEENDNVEVLARYNEQFYKDAPAVTRNKYGNGEVYYFASVLNRDASIGFAKTMAEEHGLDIVENLPKGVEITYRYGEKKWRFIFNNTEKKQEVVIGKEKITLNPFDMEIEVV